MVETETEDLRFSKNAITVLPPHGKIELVEHCASDLDVVDAARVSFGKQAVAAEDGGVQEGDAKLIQWLIEHSHGTPLEHTFFKFRVRAPIFVFREWHRHRIGCCVTGDAVIDFVDINGHRAPGISRTLSELWDRWETGEISGVTTDEERVDEALALVGRGVSVRAAASKTGISRGTIDRRLDGSVNPGKRGSRWRVEGMRIRVLDESTGRFTHSHIEDVIQSGVKEVVLLKTENHEVKLTSDHEVCTPEGWRPAGSLSVGDKVARPGKVAKHERQIPPRLREGIGLWTQSLREELIQDNDACYECGGVFSREELALDHVVPVIEDLSLALTKSNLKPACEKCHRQKTNGEQALAKRGTVIGVRWESVTAAPEVVGEEMTYDLSVSGHHNFVANGLVVHNSINEESGRYIQLDPDFWLPDDEAVRKQVGKPGHYSYESVGAEHINGSKSLTHGTEVRLTLEEAYDIAYSNYEHLLNSGYAKEIARACLPVGLYSTMIWSCNARSLMAFFTLRSAPDAQREIRQYSLAMEKIFAKIMPATYWAFELSR